MSYNRLLDHVWITLGPASTIMHPHFDLVILFDREINRSVNRTFNRATFNRETDHASTHLSLLLDRDSAKWDKLETNIRQFNRF